MVGSDRSHISHVERGVRNPTPKVVRAWLAVCPLPALPPDALSADLFALATKAPRAVGGDSPVNDWICANLLESETIGAALTSIRARWISRSAKALHFPAPDKMVSLGTEPQNLDLAALLWLVFRSARYQAVAPEALAAINPIVPISSPSHNGGPAGRTGKQIIGANLGRAGIDSD